MNVPYLIFLFLRVLIVAASAIPSEIVSTSEKLDLPTISKADSELSCFSSSDDGEDEQSPYDTSILWGIKPARRVRFDLPEEVPEIKKQEIVKASPVSVAEISDEWNRRDCTLDWIQNSLIPTFLRGEMIPNYIIKKIIEEASFEFSYESSIHQISVPKNGKVIVVGDIHGQFESTLSIFEEFGYPSKELVYLFNGDIVDRGDKSLECILMIFAYKIALADSFFVTRGNHESRTVVNEKFYEDCQSKLKDFESAFNDFHDAFETLPYGYVIKKEIFVTHGGLCADIYLSDIQNLFRNYFNCYNTPEFHSMLWNDPCELDVPVDDFGMASNPRGSGCKRFNTNVTKSFLQNNDLKLLVRSHQAVPEGFLLSQENCCVTVFSAPNYLGRNIRGAVLIIEEKDAFLKQMRYFISKN